MDVIYSKKSVGVKELIKNHTNNTMIQFFYSISILLSFLSVFCINVVFAEVDVTSSSENSSVSFLISPTKTPVDSPKEINHVKKQKTDHSKWKDSVGYG